MISQERKTTQMSKTTLPTQSDSIKMFEFPEGQGQGHGQGQGQTC